MTNPSTPHLQSLPSQATAPVLPWWRYPMVWLVVGGPMAVVLAGLTTVVIAYQHVDPVLDVSGQTTNASDKPAIQARNLAADLAVKPHPDSAKQAAESP